MNGMIDIKISDNALERANRALRQILSQSPQAVSRAVNRTMDGLRTDAVRETSKKYFVKAKDVRSSITFRKATAGNLMGVMMSKGKRHSLADYQLTPSSPKPGGKTQLKGAVKREGGLKSLGPAFLVKRAGGRYFPFYRVGSGSGNRYKGIQSLISPETVKAMEHGAEERFAKRLDHEIKQLLGIFS